MIEKMQTMKIMWLWSLNFIHWKKFKWCQCLYNWKISSIMWLYCFCLTTSFCWLWNTKQQCDFTKIRRSTVNDWHSVLINVQKIKIKWKLISTKFRIYLWVLINWKFDVTYKNNYNQCVLFFLILFLFSFYIILLASVFAEFVLNFSEQKLFVNICIIKNDFIVDVVCTWFEAFKTNDVDKNCN